MDYKSVEEQKLKPGSHFLQHCRRCGSLSDESAYASRVVKNILINY